MLNILITSVLIALFLISCTGIIYFIVSKGYKLFTKKEIGGTPSWVNNFVFLIMTLILAILMVFVPIIFKGDLQ